MHENSKKIMVFPYVVNYQLGGKFMQKAGLLTEAALCLGFPYVFDVSPVLDAALIGTGMLCIYTLTKDKRFTIIGNRYKKLFEGIGLKNKKDHYPFLKKKEKTMKGYKLYFTLPNGLSSFDFTKHKYAIQQHLNAQRIDITYANHNVIIDVVDKKLEKSYCYQLKEATMRGQVPCVIGWSHSKIEVVDLAKGEPHMGIYGETGSGKSTIERGIIVGLLQSDNVNLHLIDMKRGCEFGMFAKCRQVKSLAKNKNDAIKVLSVMEKEIENRYDLFDREEVVDIKEYNQKFKIKPLSYEVIIIDEFAELDDEDSMKVLERVSAIARACGIHLIIATQRPSADVITGRIKANIPVIVGLKCSNGVSSRVVIDKQGLELLRGEGHGFLRKKGKEIEFQAMQITPKEARAIAKSYYVDKSKQDQNNCDEKIIKLDFLEEL